jgi:4-deoxy-L-threo-5-hexosulose-uronate ketol-isomerase
MKVLHSVHPEDFKSYDTAKTRERFLMEDLARPGSINFTYTHYDRMIAGVAMPAGEPLDLGNYDNLKSSFFLERREMGIINLGGPATISVGKEEFPVQKLDCLYLGRGTTNVRFSAANAQEPPVLFILSAPAHATHPVRLMKKEEALPSELGSSETSNRRTIYKYIHKDGIQSCQLVMGLTILQSGSTWNTMPPHTHDRRMEVYFYFDVPEGQAVFHFMGQPEHTRHVLMSNYQAIVSPPWSIHAGSGTSNYGFIWGMAGENMEFTDMDGVKISEIK